MIVLIGIAIANASLLVHPIAPPDSTRLAGALPRVETREPRPDSTQRKKAIEYSDWYDRRLTIHRWGSYVEFPLFAAEYAVGQKLMNATTPSQSLRGVHGALAGGTAVLFGVNTATGLWNLWDSRHDPAGRGRRLVHSALMVAADAGFVWTGALANNAGEGSSIGGSGFNARRHRQVAVSSMAVSALGTLMMWFWKD